MNEDNIEDKIKKELMRRIGKDASEKDIANYMANLTPKDFLNLLSDLNDSLSSEERETLMNDEFINALPDDGFGGTGLLECMPVTELKKYTLRIKLRGISPSIWRKIEVPSSVKLTSLAEIILTAMGWYNVHLHQFVTKGRAELYATADPETENMAWGQHKNWGGNIPISHLLKAEKDKVVFEYDYGDSWEHEVTLSKAEDYADGEEPRVRLIGGKRACPPEDCGGVWGYSDLCEAMKHPYSAHAKELKNWLGYLYDPEEFWLEDAQEEIDGFNRT